MPRPLKVDRPVEKSISIPQSIVVAVELELWSDLEGKLPFGAWQKYITKLIEEDMQRRQALRAKRGAS